LPDLSFFESPAHALHSTGGCVAPQKTGHSVAVLLNRELILLPVGAGEFVDYLIGFDQSVLFPGSALHLF
jgi:hypothetical protein